MTNVYGANSLLFTNGTSSRTFETVNQQPMFNALNVQLVKNGTIGGIVELEAGSNANVIASYPENIDSFDVTQLYVSYNPGPLSLIVGKFETLAGAEVIEDPLNTNISRSLLFGFGGPGSHTGARLTYAPSSTFSIIGGVDNGWDNLKGNGTGAKTAEYGIAYKGTVFQVAAQGYSGTERINNLAWSAGDPALSRLGHRSLIDAVITYNATPKLTFVGNVDHGQQDNAPILGGNGVQTTDSFGAPLFGTDTWTGVAGYATYRFTPRWYGSLRGETFTDSGGYRTGFDQHWREATLTIGYALSPSLLFRLEGRADVSNRAVWTNANGALRNTLRSAEAQAIVKF
jgi:Putative beta-barrel porin-2, OmpL-like. bbp2